MLNLCLISAVQYSEIKARQPCAEARPLFYFFFTFFALALKEYLNLQYLTIYKLESRALSVISRHARSMIHILALSYIGTYVAPYLLLKTFGTDAFSVTLLMHGPWCALALCTHFDM